MRSLTAIKINNPSAITYIRWQKNKITILFYLSLLLICPLPGNANSLSPIFSLSQGGAGGASLKEDMSYLINPATMGFQNKLKGAVLYSFKQKQKTALASFLDIKTKLPLAITYQRFWSDSFRRSGKDKMFISSGFKISPNLSLGLTVERELQPSLWNGNIGSVLKLGNQMSLALFLNQILKIKNQNRRSLTMAFYYDWRHFFSTHLDISKTARKEWIFRGGMESFFHDFLSIRFGGVWFQKMQKGLVSGGLTFQSPKLILEYSIQKDEDIYQQAIALIFRM